MKGGEKDNISKKASEYMEQCGIPHKLHSKMLYNICDIVNKNKDLKKAKFRSLFSSVNILSNDIWNHALAIVLTFLKENLMDLTLDTMKIEYEQLQSIIDSLKIDEYENSDQLLARLLEYAGSQRNFQDLLQSFLGELPLKNTIDLSKELYPDIVSSESLGPDISNINSDDNSLNNESFHDI